MNQQFAGLNTRSLLIAGLIAGVAIGLLSSIPLISCVNCLLFGWVWLGGIAAVYLYRQNEHQLYLTTTQGIVIGALAGVVGAIVGGVVGLLLAGLSTAFSEMLTRLAGESGTVIPGFLLGAGASVFRIVLDVFLYAIFGAIGGIIATALIWKAPAVMPPPPPYNPPPAGPVI